MIDDIYKNSFKEVYVILQNTDKELVDMIPLKFIDFIKSNMNSDYITNIKTDVTIDDQKLLKETEAVLSLIYRSYWATEQEKAEFAINDKNDFIHRENLKKENYKGKDVYKMFEEKENLNNVILADNLVVLKKENFLKKFFKKIFYFIRVK